MPVDSVEDCAAECANDSNCFYYGFKDHDGEYAWCTLYPTDYLITSTADGSMLGSCVKTEPAPVWQCNKDGVCVAAYSGEDLKGNISAKSK